MKYKEITIETVENIYNLGIEMICDADHQEIIFDDALTDIINSIRDGLMKAIKPIADVAKIIASVFIRFMEKNESILNKKISKKRFIKLLQSRGIPRTKINKTIKNNQDKYTMWRVIAFPPI